MRLRLNKLQEATPLTPAYLELTEELTGVLVDSDRISELLRSGRLPAGVRQTPGYLEFRNPTARTKPALYAWNPPAELPALVRA